MESNLISLVLKCNISFSCRPLEVIVTIVGSHTCCHGNCVKCWKHNTLQEATACRHSWSFIPEKEIYHNCHWYKCLGSDYMFNFKLQWKIRCVLLLLKLKTCTFDFCFKIECVCVSVYTRVHVCSPWCKSEGQMTTFSPFTMWGLVGYTRIIMFSSKCHYPWPNLPVQIMYFLLILKTYFIFSYVYVCLGLYRYEDMNASAFRC